MSTCTRIYVLGIFSNEFNRKLVYVELIEINCQNSRILETEKKTNAHLPWAIADIYVSECVCVHKCGECESERLLDLLMGDTTWLE